MDSRKYCIYGTGGFGRETLTMLDACYSSSGRSLSELAVFMVSDEYANNQEVMGVSVIKESAFHPEKYKVVVAVAETRLREQIVNRLPSNTMYTQVIHPSSVVSRWATIGEGAIIAAGVVITCNVSIGRHAHLNLNTTVGHDCSIGDFFTAAPLTAISGNCSIGNRVYMGTQSSTRQGVEIFDQVTIGMSSTVLNDVPDEGVYIGSPLRKLKEKN